ncbi:hypothetical protein Syun_007349 [Stephania yunnanensis]|uniref:Uncharacterized protein n=1 Tax=Stephania yunnanensis TaxID=152371 RepID=A0AAP0KYC1_9MAGN
MAAAAARLLDGGSRRPAAWADRLGACRRAIGFCGGAEEQRAIDDRRGEEMAEQAAVAGGGAGEPDGGATVMPAAARWRQRRWLGSGNDVVNDAMTLSNRIGGVNRRKSTTRWR